MNYSTNIPWEFDPASPSRSISLLYLVYGPLLWLNKHWLHFRPLALMYMARLQLVTTYFITVQIATSILCETKQEVSKTLFFIFTSYITWTYQSHTFSNSIETQVLLLTLCLIHLLRQSEKSKVTYPHYRVSLLMGALIAIGTFNRITFLSFLIFPMLTLIKRFLRFKLSFLLLIASTIVTSLVLIYFDTVLFQSDEYVITPLNNLIYNSQVENLARHGLHPRYTHVLVNLPQIIGPAIIPFFFRNHYKASIPYLSIFSGLLFLSIVPHQELRFLTPLVPLICICIDFTNFETPRFVELIMTLWCIFNTALGIVMGSLHQRGVIESLDQLYKTGYHGSQVWWRTYSPPTWLLGNEDLTIAAQVPPYEFGDLLIDLMGCEVDQLVSTLAQLQDTLLITPRSSLPLLESIDNEHLNLELVWSYKWHLDMDHFDISDLRTFHPGIDIYKVVYGI